MGQYCFRGEVKLNVTAAWAVRWVIFLWIPSGLAFFFPMTKVLIPTSCQSATGDCLAALEVLNDNVKGGTTNIVGAAMRGKKIKLLLSWSLILCSLGISAQQGIHKNQLKTYSRNQARGFMQCSAIQCSYHKAKIVAVKLLSKKKKK